MKTLNLGVPLNNGSLVDQVIDRITNALIHKELRPGDQLPTETELTAMLQVGKSSVREAIKVLQAMGIVEVRRGEGTFITTKASATSLNPVLYQLLIEPGTTDQLVELRMIYEPAYTLLAMEKATDEDVARINAARLHFEELVSQNCQTGDSDIAFHRAILLATHNPYIIRIGDMILKVLLESVNKGSTIIPQQSIDDHNRIYEAFVARDPKGLRKAVLKSFEGWMKQQDI